MKKGFCKLCGCNWITPCIDGSYGTCWWVDESQPLCSHCCYGLNQTIIPKKVYYRAGYDWFEEDQEFAQAVLANPKRHWVYDTKHDVLCVVGLGDHIGAVRFITKEFYGLGRICREEIPKWQEIIDENMIFYNAKVTDSEHYALHLPRKYKI
ncbi:hypothetical protein [Streptococcus suis]|uniref:hypothetical protein n=1 Tax=Streptococcus suis TaxID=1307 RepID=UPI0015535322|nr:hypothetical protein [Streptococcus suis]MBM7317903.1 hypothetical protein [Streptococcus suis]MBY4963574.1 hypothetical protein [Streptococcus suis]